MMLSTVVFHFLFALHACLVMVGFLWVLDLLIVKNRWNLLQPCTWCFDDMENIEVEGYERGNERDRIDGLCLVWLDHDKIWLDDLI